MALNRIIVIGGGNMARAIIGGAIRKGLLRGDTVTVVEPDDERRGFFQTLGAEGFASIHALGDRLTNDAAVLLAIKPQVLAKIEGAMPAGYSGLVISILAGMRAERVFRAMGGECRVVRVMPNTPALVGMGMAGICGGIGSTEADLAGVETLFRGVGEVVRVEERDMDAVTAVSGSGPAYVFLLAQAMIEGARAAGLDEEIASALVTQTIRGAAEMLVNTGDTPESLRRSVTSPGGTTEAGVRVLESRDLRGIVCDAILAARDRGIELGRMGNG